MLTIRFLSAVAPLLYSRRRLALDETGCRSFLGRMLPAQQSSLGPWVGARRRVGERDWLAQLREPRESRASANRWTGTQAALRACSPFPVARE